MLKETEVGAVVRLPFTVRIYMIGNPQGEARRMNGWRKGGREGGEKVGILDSSFSLWWGGRVGGCAWQQSVGMGAGSGNRGVVE